MKLFKSADYIEQKNPNGNESYRPEIQTAQMGAKSLGGMFEFCSSGSAGTVSSSTMRGSR